MNYKHSLIATIAIVTATVAPAMAQLTNTDFETPVVGAGSFTTYGTGSTAITGWTVVGSDVLLVNTTYGELGQGITSFAAQSGVQSIDVTGAGNTSPNNGITQSFATTPGQGYQIGFFVGRAAGGTNYATPSTVDLSINGGARASFTNSNSTAGAVNWQQFFSTFTATGTTTTVSFLNGTPTTSGGGNNFAGLDNVSIVVVPEPATALLLAVPLALLGGMATRRRVVR